MREPGAALRRSRHRHPEQPIHTVLRLHESLWHVIIATQSAYSIAARSSKVVPTPKELGTTATPELLIRALTSPMTSPLRDLDIIITEGRYEGGLGKGEGELCTAGALDVVSIQTLRGGCGWLTQEKQAIYIVVTYSPQNSDACFRGLGSDSFPEQSEHVQFPGYMPKLLGKSDSIASLSLAVAYGKSGPAYERRRV